MDVPMDGISVQIVITVTVLVKLSTMRQDMAGPVNIHACIIKCVYSNAFDCLIGVYISEGSVSHINHVWPVFALNKANLKLYSKIIVLCPCTDPLTCHVHA